MKDELFNELVASVREGGAVLRGKALPSAHLSSTGQISSAFAPITSFHRGSLLPCLGLAWEPHETGNRVVERRKAPHACCSRWRPNTAQAVWDVVRPASRQERKLASRAKRVTQS